MDGEYDRFKDEEPRTEGRGRSAAKRAAKAVEEIARQLVELPEAELGKLPVSDDLRAELERTRSTRGRGGAKRQLKHFAGLLRRHEEARDALQAWLEGYHADHFKEVQAFHGLEQLRERLCSPEESARALDEVRSRYPDIDVSRLEGLIRSVHATRDKKAFREIFRRLKDAEAKLSS